MKSRIAAALMIASLAAACTDAGTGPENGGNPGVDPLKGVEAASLATVLSADSVPAGTWTEVTCTLLDTDGNVVDNIDADVTVSVADGAELDEDGEQVRSMEPGTYAVTCESGVFPDVPKTPANLEVVPGSPEEVVLIATPEQPVYELGDKVTLSWIAYDSFDNEMHDLEGTVTPAGGGVEAGAEPNTFVFTDEGEHIFQLSLASPYEYLSDTLTLTCDAFGPSISVKSPVRGATLVGTGNSVEIVGVVTDTVGDVVSLWLDGEPVSVNDDGTFATTLKPSWGLNAINLEAEDSFGNKESVSPTFHYSSSYMAFIHTDAEGVKTDDGVELFLGQTFLDDGDHDPTQPNDLATIVSSLLTNIDIASLVMEDGPLHFEFDLFNQSVDLTDVQLSVAGTLNIDVTVLEATDIGPSDVSLDTRDGGIAAQIVMGTDAETGLEVALAVAITLPVTFTATVVDVPFEASAIGEANFNSGVHVDKLVLDADLAITKPAGSDLLVWLDTFDLDIEGMLIDPIQDAAFAFTVDLPYYGEKTFNIQLSDYFDLNAITDVILDPLTTYLVPILVKFFQPIVAEQLSGAMEGFLHNLSIETTFELPELLGFTPESIDIYTDLTSVEFTEDGGNVGMSLGVWALKDIQRDPLGAIVRHGCLAGLDDTVSFDWDRAIGVGAKTDALNAAFFSAWWSGYLNGPQDFSDLLGGLDLPLTIEDLTAQLYFLLPPIIDDCNSVGQLTAEIGDLNARVEFEIQGVPVEANLYIDASIALTFDPREDGLHIVLAGLENFDIEVADISRTHLGPLDLRALIDASLAVMLEQKLDGVEFGPVEIPGFDLGSMLPGLPEGTEISLDGLTVHKHPGYSVFAADLK